MITMELTFLKNLFPNHSIEIEVKEDNTEYAKIIHEEFDDIIKIFYYPGDYYEYYFSFATQHRHTSDKNELIEIIKSFINAEKAAIEFYLNGKNRFGGEIEVSLLDDITYEYLRQDYGYQNIDMSEYTFEVRAWNKKYCFNGSFEMTDSGKIAIIKNFL